MNINLADAASKQRKNVKSQKSKNVRYGLNDRKKSQNILARKKAVFSNCDSSDDDVDSTTATAETGTVGGRHHVNRALVAEQLALRNRAEMTMARTTSTASDVFDYDGQYESFSLGYQNKVSEKAKKDSGKKKIVLKEKKESRYVADLLRHAKNRQQEREIIEERKIAKEQAEDEKEYIGKEKFVTNAYKRKLVERESWLMEEEERSKKEQAEDVTKKNDGSAIVASFYGNLSRNIAMGAVNQGEANETKLQCSNHARNNNQRDSDSDRKKLDVYEANSRDKSRTNVSELRQTEDMVTTNECETMRAKLVTKILTARERYLKRKQVVLVT